MFTRLLLLLSCLNTGAGMKAGGKGDGQAPLPNNPEWRAGYEVGIGEGLRRAAVTTRDHWQAHAGHVERDPGPARVVVGEALVVVPVGWPDAAQQGAPEQAVGLLRQLVSFDVIDAIRRVLEQLSILQAGGHVVLSAPGMEHEGHQPAGAGAAPIPEPVVLEPDWDAQPDGVWWCRSHSNAAGTTQGAWVDSGRFANNQARNRAGKRKCEDCSSQG